MQSVNCRVQSAECRVQSVKCRVYIILLLLLFCKILTKYLRTKTFNASSYNYPLHVRIKSHPHPSNTPHSPSLFLLVKCPNSLRLPLQLYFNQINLFALNALLDLITRQHLSDTGCPKTRGFLFLLGHHV